MDAHAIVMRAHELASSGELEAALETVSKALAADGMLVRGWEVKVGFRPAMDFACSESELAQAFFEAATAFRALGLMDEAAVCAREFCDLAPENDPRWKTAREIAVPR